MANLLRKGDRTEQVVSLTSTRKGTSSVAAVSTSKKAHATAFNPWDLTQIWIEGISKEESTRKQWEQMYGWMADYDAKGNLKPRKRTLENSTRFSNTIPNSRGHDYGWRLQSGIGKEIDNLQKRFQLQYKKRLPTVVLGFE